MSVKNIIPAPAEIAREAVIVIGGALLAALIVGQVPAIRQWIKDQWGGTPPTP